MALVFIIAGLAFKNGTVLYMVVWQACLTHTHPFLGCTTARPPIHRAPKLATRVKQFWREPVRLDTRPPARNDGFDLLTGPSRNLLEDDVMKPDGSRRQAILE